MLINAEINNCCRYKRYHILLQVKWFPAGNIYDDIKIFHLTIFNIVWVGG
jgi:hypothetical protein